MSNEVLLTGNDISPVRVHVDTGDLCNVQIMYNAFKYQARLYAPKHEFLFIHVANM